MNLRGKKVTYRERLTERLSEIFLKHATSEEYSWKGYKLVYAFQGVPGDQWGVLRLHTPDHCFYTFTLPDKVSHVINLKLAEEKRIEKEKKEIMLEEEFKQILGDLS